VKLSLTRAPTPTTPDWKLDFKDVHPECILYLKDLEGDFEREGDSERGREREKCQSTLKPSFYFSSIVKAHSNPFREPTSTNQ